MTRARPRVARAQDGENISPINGERALNPARRTLPESEASVLQELEPPVADDDDGEEEEEEEEEELEAM